MDIGSTLQDAYDRAKKALESGAPGAASVNAPPVSQLSPAVAPPPAAPPSPPDVSNLDPTAGTEVEAGDESQSTREAIAEMRARESGTAAAGAAVGGKAAVPMAVAPANINYAPVGGKAAFDTAYGELPLAEQDALGGLHNTTADGLKAQAESKAEEANQLAQMAENSRLREEQRSKALMDHVANYTRMADQMAAQRFDAGRYWKNPGNVLAAFSMSLLPLAGVSPEKAIGLVNDAVQRDWSAQQIDYERAQNRAAAELSTIGQLRSIYGDERAAEDAFRAQSYKAMAAKAQSVALRGQSEEQRKLATLLASQYATQAAQAQARAKATLYQGAHIAPAQLVGAQVREGEKTYTDPAVNALYGRKDGVPSPPAPGEAPGDNPATGMPDHPPTEEERNRALAAAALAKVRGVPVPPQVQAVIDLAKRTGGRIAGALGSVKEAVVGDLGAPEATAQPSVMERARANFGLPPRPAQSGGVTTAAELRDPRARSILMEAEKTYGGMLPPDKAAELVRKFQGKTLPNGSLKESAREEIASEVASFKAFAESPRGKDQARFIGEDEQRHAGAAKDAFLSNYAKGMEAQLLAQGVKFIEIPPGTGPYPEIHYKVDKTGFPVLAKGSSAAAEKAYTTAINTATNDTNDALKAFHSTVTSHFGKPSDFLPFAAQARSAATAQKKFMNALGNDRQKIDTMLGYFRDSDTTAAKSALERFGIKGPEAEDVLAYNVRMKSMSNAYRNQMTGSAFSPAEAKEFANLFSPEISFQRQQAIIANVLQLERSAIEEAIAALPLSARARVMSDLQRRGVYTPGKASGAYSTPGSVPR